MKKDQHIAEILWAVLVAENYQYIARDFDIGDNEAFLKIRKVDTRLQNLCNIFEQKIQKEISAEDGMWVLSQIAFGKTISEYSERTGRELSPIYLTELTKDNV